MGRKINNEILVREFKETHGDKYDYSLVDYKNAKTKVKIICKEHGVFEQTIGPHRNGTGCPYCTGRIPISEDMAIKEFKEVHGDKYDYSLVKYISVKVKVKIICKEHGVFEQAPTIHKNGSGCPICSTTARALKRRNSTSTEEVITRFKNTHGERYDYSEVIYNGVKTKVKIKCREHGVFEQAVNVHSNGSGCPLCNGCAKPDTELAIKQFISVHGDKYDYSLVDYKKAHTPVKIICKEHGVFQQAPTHHKSGQGCSKCSGKYIYSKQEILEEFKKVHGDRYDYSEVIYSHTECKVKIICKEHGIFEQQPRSHKRGANCPKCAGSWFKTQDEAISEFKEVHGDLYDYSLVEYKNVNTKVKIICAIHGIFEQTPLHHHSGRICIRCSGFYSPSLDEVINRFKGVHGDLFDYSLVEYTTSTTKVKIICKEHGVFEQIPASHWIGCGCPICGKDTFNGRGVYKNRKTTLYYIKLKYAGKTTYKIGLTLKNIKTRFSQDRKKGVKIELINKWVYEDGALAYDKEQDILLENRVDKYYGPDILIGGNSELFNVDVLGLVKTTKEITGLLF